METTPSSSSTTTTSKKKKVSKREVQKQSPVAVAAAVEEKAASHGGDREEGSCPVAAAATVVENEGNDDGLSMACNDQDWRAWWRPEVLVDEQMSWGSVWFSFWEQENDNCHAMFYSDVLEEDDIWDLRSIKQVPQ